MNEINYFLSKPSRYLITRISLLFFYFRCQGRVIGDDIITRNKENGFVLIANHQSFLDWLVLWGYFQSRHQINLTFLAKAYLFEHWLWRRIIDCSCCVKTSNEGDRILDPGGFKRLIGAQYVAIFPEGTRTRDGQLLPFHKGATRIAQKSGKAVIPIALDGFYKAWPPGEKFPRAARCRLVIGEPTVIDRKEDVDVATDYLRTAILELLPNG